MKENIQIHTHHYVLPLLSLVHFLSHFPYSHEEQPQFPESGGGRESAHLQLPSHLRRHGLRLCSELLL